jgi:hypothetical protein
VSRKSFARLWANNPNSRLTPLWTCAGCPILRRPCEGWGCRRPVRHGVGPSPRQKKGRGKAAASSPSPQERCHPEPASAGEGSAFHARHARTVPKKIPTSKRLSPGHGFSRAKKVPFVLLPFARPSRASLRLVQAQPSRETPAAHTSRRKNLLPLSSGSAGR